MTFMLAEKTLPPIHQYSLSLFVLSSSHRRPPLSLTHHGRVVSAGVRSYGRARSGSSLVRALGGRYVYACISECAPLSRRPAYGVPGSVIEFPYTPIDDLITELDFPIGTRKQCVAQQSTRKSQGKIRSAGPRLWARRGKSGHHASGRVHRRWTSVPVPPTPESAPPRTRPEPAKMASPEGRHALRVLFRARRRGHHTRVRWDGQRCAFLFLSLGRGLPG